MSRTTKIILLIVAAPFALVALLAIWGTIILIVALTWHSHSDSQRFASLQPYASQLTLLPAPATLVGTHQNASSSSLGESYGLNIERDYTFKSPVSPQAIYTYYSAQLTSRGWLLDVSQTNTPNSSSENKFSWQRAGTHGDTIFYTVIYYPDGSAPPAYGGGTAAPLELEIESEPNNAPKT